MSPPLDFPVATGFRFPVVVPLLLIGLLAGVASVRAAIKEGDAFPPLTASGVAILAGGELSDPAGKVMLVDFWASWCAPCKASFPAMAKLHSEYSRRGLVVVAVSVDEKLADAMLFVKKLAPPFLTLHDRQQNLVKQVVVPTMPTSYLVGRDGKVRLVQSGYHGDASDQELRKRIEVLLAGQN